ncbi:MAG TPA: 50S ribosomal protein L18e [Thermoplasmatales archaeon]|nr:50S ribosomal protein L18e [Thermoplasmatales archaeon]
MVKKTSKTNPHLIALIQDLKKKSFEHDVAIWKDVALRLEKPSRNWAEVNLSKIERYVGEDEIALVPGKVLSSGRLSKKIKVAAWGFSYKAREKIQKAGGKCLSIEDLVKENPSGKGVRIVR